MTPREVLALCREKEIKAVDLRFMDFPGMQKHFTVPVQALTPESFEDGFGFDGSSIRGWASSLSMESFASATASSTSRFTRRTMASADSGLPVRRCTYSRKLTALPGSQ